jgi:hypothetical protein
MLRSARGALESLVADWRSGLDLSLNVFSIFKKDCEDISIFEYSGNGGENLFDLIQTTVSQHEKVSFTMALLRAFDT